MIRKLLLHILFVFVLTLVCILGTAYIASNYLAPYRPQPAVDPYNHASWVRAKGDEHYVSYFRHTIDLSGSPRRAWLRISARDGYELSINNDVVSKSTLWRPTRPYRSGSTEVGQVIGDTHPMLQLNYPREYQWHGHRKYKIPSYIDITPYLIRGKNIITVKVESRTAPAKLIFEGAANLWSGTTVRINSGEDTLAMPTPRSFSNLPWNNKNYNDDAWLPAVSTPAPEGHAVTLVSPEIFKRPFESYWLRSGHSETDFTAIFTHKWDIESKPKSAYIRVMSNRAYKLTVNGRRAHSRTNRGGTLSDGNWILRNARSIDHVTNPELLDPDETSQLTIGKHFLEPPSRDQNNLKIKTPKNSLERLQHFNTNRNQDPFDLTGAFSSVRNMFLGPENYVPQYRIPTMLTRNRNSGTFDAFDISALLKKGINKIEIEPLNQTSQIPMNWQSQVAADLSYTFHDNSTHRLTTDQQWLVEIQNSTGQRHIQQAYTYGKVERQENSLPALRYQGYSYNQRDKLKTWGIISVFIVSLLGSFVIYRHRRLIGVVFGFISDNKSIDRIYLIEQRKLAQTSIWLLIPASTIFGMLITKYGWSEREELLLFLDGTLWFWGMYIALIAWAISTVWLFKKYNLEIFNTKNSFINFIKKPTLYIWLIWIIIIFGVFLRAIDIDFQTIDDDEYASIQAIQGILATGAPAFNDDIWYTRSPLYHYLTAAICWVFGLNIFTLRLVSVFWAACTLYLTYRCGRDILKSPAIGIAGAFLCAIHPFLIYTSHIARFYQQTQFFTLLTIYFFCMGFSGAKQSFPHRIACIISFFLAILSHELSVVIGLQLLFGYIIFARPFNFELESKTIIISACVVLLATVNIMIFQAKTLTHLEGISPNFEATLAPNFKSPMNFLSVFLGYSRLHLSLSILFLVGLPFALYRTDKQLLAFYFMLFSGIIVINLFVTGNSLRYQYGLIPIWILLGLMGPKLVIDKLNTILIEGKELYNPNLIKTAICSILFIAVTVSWSPWRILSSYDSKLLGDATGAFQYIKTNLREGDKVAATEPHPHGMLIETGQSDYDITFPLLYDFVYRNSDGDLVDRGAQAKVVNTVENLIRIFAKHDRIWIAINHERFRSRGTNLRWEYPGARAHLFLRKNCVIAYQSYLWTVYLWDNSNGRYHNFRHNWSR